MSIVEKRELRFRDVDKDNPPSGNTQGYLVHWIRNPDKGSSFDLKTVVTRILPDDLVMKTLLNLRYGALLLMEERQVIAHVFYQRHGDALHMFSVYSDGQYPDAHIGTRSLVEFMARARAKTGITKVRLGAGGSPWVKRFLDRLAKREVPGIEYNYTILPGGWVRFVDKGSR